MQKLEEQIINAYDGPISKSHDYTDERCLLEVRRNIINHYVLQYQEELLPDIIAFNDALREALHKMFDKAHVIYEANKGFGDAVWWKLAAICAANIQLYIQFKVRTVRNFGMLCKIQAGTCCTTVALPSHLN